MTNSPTAASLANEFCAITVDECGIVRSLVNKITGSEFIRSPADGAWKVITSLGGWTDHPVHARDCRGTLAASGHELVVAFEHLMGAEGARLEIALRLSFELFPGSDEILCTYVLENRSREVVSEVWFPVVGGLESIGGTGEGAGESYLAVGDSLGRRIADPARTLPTNLLSAKGNRPGDRGIGYPGPGSMGWLEYYTAGEGLHVASHDASLARTTLLARREGPRSFMLGIASYPCAKPGATYRSPTSIVAAHVGDWHVGADKYRSFMHTWLPDLVTPAWLRDAPAVRLVFMKHQTGHVYAKYKDLVGVHARMKKRRLGAVPLVVYGWFAGGHDAGYPSYAAAHDLGGEDELRRALRAIGDEGGHVILFVNGMLMDQAGPYYASDTGRAACMKNREMRPYTDEYSYQEEGTVYPGKTFAVGCVGSAEWSDEIWKATERVLDLGADGILIDQIGGYSSHLCFDESHGHETPAEASSLRFDLLQRIRSRAADIEPAFGLMVEMHADGFAHFADLVHSHSYDRHAEGEEPFAEMYRYTMPDQPSTSRHAWTVPALNYAFALGLAPEYVPPDDPLFQVMERKHGHAFDEAFVERLERMIRLRARLAPHLIRGRFMDEEGITSRPDSMFAKAFASVAGRTTAVVVWNRGTRKATGTIAMKRATSKWTLHRLEGSPEVHETDVGEAIAVGLDADEVAVVVAG